MAHPIMKLIKILGEILLLAFSAFFIIKGRVGLAIYLLLLCIWKSISDLHLVYLEENDEINYKDY